MVLPRHNYQLVPDFPRTVDELVPLELQLAELLLVVQPEQLAVVVALLRRPLDCSQLAGLGVGLEPPTTGLVEAIIVVVAPFSNALNTKPSLRPFELSRITDAKRSCLLALTLDFAA